MKIVSALKNARGFTLVELIVVIGIIGVLSSIVYANFGSARTVARDEVRKTSVKDLELAIRLYKAQNGTYPDAGCGTSAGNFAGPGPSGAAWANSCDEYIDGLTPDFIAQLPQDPNQEQDSNKGFYYRSDGISYKLMVYNTVETKVVTSATDEFARCPSFSSCGGSSTDRAKTYTVYSANAAQW